MLWWSCQCAQTSTRTTHLSGEVGPDDDAEDVVGLGHEVEENEVALDKVVEAARRGPVQREVHNSLNISWGEKANLVDDFVRVLTIVDIWVYSW